VLDRTRVYWPRAQSNFKPNGLWVSVEGYDGDETWGTWCVTNDFRVDHLVHRTEIILAPNANVRHIATEDELRRFDVEFGRGNDLRPWLALERIDWPRVQAHYSGIIIAPYQWRARMELLWYYGWDCSSACLWDLNLIADARAIEGGKHGASCDLPQVR
jgi:hypothetical protein